MHGEDYLIERVLRVAFLLFGIDFLLLATFVSSSFFVSLGTK